MKFIEFDHNDVARHPLVAKIVKAYQKKIDDLINLRIKTSQMFLDAVDGCDYLIPQKQTEEYVAFDHKVGEELPHLKGKFRWDLEKYYRDRYGPYLPEDWPLCLM